MGIGANTQNIEPSIHDENVWSCKKDRSVYFEGRSLVCSFPSPAPALSLSWSSCSAPASTWRSWWSGWRLTLPTPPSRRSSPPTGSRWHQRVNCYAPTQHLETLEIRQNSGLTLLTLSCLLVQCDNLHTVLDVAGWQGVARWVYFYSFSIIVQIIQNHGREELEELKEHMSDANIDILLE